MAEGSGSPSSSATSSAYPANTASASSTLSSTPTTAIRIAFSDKILLTVSQAGRLNHWIHVPLANVSPPDTSMPQQSMYAEVNSDAGDGQVDSTLLPYTHLTATTVLGGTKPEFETLGQTLATTIASAVLMSRPGEQRMLVLGLGLERADVGRKGFEELVGLCLEVL